MPAFINQEDILFIRQLERKLQKVKYDKAAELKAATIDELLTNTTDIGSPESDHISYAYKTLKTSKNERDLKEAQKKVDDYLKLRVAYTYKQHNSAIDRVALGLNDDEKIPANPFYDIWEELRKDYLLDGTAPEHHADLLERLKYAFEIQKGKKSAQALHDEYHEARSKYYQLLRAKHEKKKLWTAPTNNKLHYALGYENQHIQNEIENKKEDQKLLTHGLFWAKVFATAQAFFVSGGTWGILALYGLTAGWWMALSIPLVSFFFLNVSRSNWLTINEEMGPLLKYLFFDPALAHLSYPKRFWYMIRRTNIFDGWNTFKGATNLVAGSFLGILTFAGSMTLLSFLPGVPLLGEFGLGVFGTGSVLVIAFSAAMALITTFVYFVINNIRQQQLNKNPNAIKEEQERLEKLRAITNTSKYNPFKRYGFNIAVGMTGVAGLLIGAAPDFFGISHSFLGAATNFFSFIHPSFAGLPFAGLITAALAGMALYGIMSFYQFRTLGSTERLIAGKTGLTFDGLSGTKLDNFDVTGRDAPDFASPLQREFSNDLFGKIARKIYEAGTYFFNMDPKRDNSQYVRVGNAMGQGMPAFMGSMGFSAILMKFAFEAFASGMAGSAVNPIIFAASMTVGVLSGVFAFWASYSANSAGLRVVKETVTEMEVLNRDKSVMQPKVSRDLQQTVYYHLGEDKAKTELYVQSRQRHGDVYWGSGYFWGTTGYTKDQKLDAAGQMLQQLDNWVEGSHVPDVTTEDKYNVTSVEEVDNRTVKRLNFLYGRPYGTTDGRNPLMQGELSDIAYDVDYLIGGKAKDVYSRGLGDEESKLERMETVRSQLSVH